MSIDRWVDKEDGILLSHKKGWKFAICSNMDRLGGHYGKWNKSERERQILYVITYMWNLKIQQTGEYNNKEADLQM